MKDKYHTGFEPCAKCGASVKYCNCAEEEKEKQLEKYEEELFAMDREELETEYIACSNLTAHEIEGLYKKTNTDLVADLVDKKAYAII